MSVGNTCCPLKIRGQHIEQYVSENQDRARNARNRSLEAAFAAWAEDLRSDQTKFEADKILILGFHKLKISFFHHT